MKPWSPEPGRPRRDAGPTPFLRRAVLRCGDATSRPDLVIAAPVCDEAERIVACIDALAATLSRRPRAGGRAAGQQCDRRHRP